MQISKKLERKKIRCFIFSKYFSCVVRKHAESMYFPTSVLMKIWIQQKALKKGENLASNLFWEIFDSNQESIETIEAPFYDLATIFYHKLEYEYFVGEQ